MQRGERGDEFPRIGLAGRLVEGGAAARSPGDRRLPRTKSQMKNGAPNASLASECQWTLGTGTPLPCSARSV